MTVNKNILYGILVALFMGGVGFIIQKANKEIDKNPTYRLQDRKGPLAIGAEWDSTKMYAQRLYSLTNNNSKDKKSALALATLFIKEARITGNYSYYDMAAMQQVQRVLVIDSNNFQALAYKALIYLSQHHFADGLAIANKAVNIAPYNSFIYGILVDANIEMGNYADAVNNAEKMVSLHPDLRSYSRISYLREIHGDYPGAIAAMKLALQAGIDGDEGTEWTRVQLGHLFENTGSLDTAEFNFQQALEFRKGFAPAIIGLAHVALIKKNYAKATALYQEADTLVVDYTNKQNLATIYRLTSKPIKADSLVTLELKNMDKDVSANNQNISHYADKELAYAYLFAGKNEKGLEHALAEYNRRPNNIEANETLAWAYYKNNDFSKASGYMDNALKTNCKNPILLCRGGLIYAKTGNNIKARLLLTEALQKDPGIDMELKNESRETLRLLNK